MHVVYKQRVLSLCCNIERVVGNASCHSQDTMTICLYIACAVFMCTCACVAWRRDRRARMIFDGISHYPMLPFIGNLHQFYGDGRQLFRHIVKLAELADQTMLPFGILFGPCPVLVTQDPEDIKTITNAFIEKPYYYSFGKPWLGNGLVTAPGSIWKVNIKKLAGTFTTPVVDGYQGVFNAQAQKLVENLKTEVGKEPFDVMDKYLAYTTLEAICQTALGVSKISERIVTTEYYKAFNRCLELMVARGLNVCLHPDFIYRLTPAYREFNKCVAVIHNVSDTVIKRRKLERQGNKNKERLMHGTENDEPKFKAFLDILMDLSDIDPSLTEQQIKSEVDTIIVGGQETVASTIFYTLLMIGCKPRIQDKLYAEFKSILGCNRRPVNKDDMSKMKYCEAVINETLRMFPPLPGVMRYADRDLQIKSCVIPKGCAIGINGWGAGRSRRVWGPDAQLYRPERWLEEKLPGNPAAFMAFSYGRRSCIGKKYAMAILKTVLAWCVRELEVISEAEGMELKVDIALRPISGHMIRVRRRDEK